MFVWSPLGSPLSPVPKHPTWASLVWIRITAVPHISRSVTVYSSNKTQTREVLAGLLTCKHLQDVLPGALG